ncbi:methyltransferase family protein [Flagellimonas pacifica]|uniref:Protein-S-isoprenylcysteine O-methyltransferase Ste14 n=1 Tax=Flagellimonas pacifica TaxID=1247520 RepID=A0A285MUS2_9FLAO|nr:methyltransferase [Allomuricauda parva]SNZ00924.1 Protein-S-isoprenylcysteine O-methyltransferase Ste14 [Allomuricauda parva]
MKGTAYLVQATIILLWWLGLSISPNLFAAFQFPEISSLAFNSFFAPDIIIITVLSIVRAYRPIRDLELIILGGFAYGSFYCLNASILSGGGYLATTIMLLGLGYNLFLVYYDYTFKESKSSKIWVNALKTFVQIVCVWIITLVFFPWVIMQAFEIDIVFNNTNAIPSIILFLFSSFLGLFSAYTFVKKGEGTPLPIDQTKKLVINGPYKYVRNPMAIAGMGQGIAVSLYFNSIHILVYALIGGLIWHLVVKPIEEKNMINRFGEDYLMYQKKVRCWIPTLKTQQSNK